jgi:hypothetical protein
MHPHLSVSLTVLSVLGAAIGAGAKESSRLVTAEMRARALRNAAQFPWVKAWQQEYVKAAEPWVTQSDADLWRRVSSQELPRAVYLAAGLLYEGKPDACPNCGKAFGFDGRTDFWKREWKVACPHCQETFPKNDFGAFYQSSLDEQGYFRRDRGDRSLLFNADHPDANDPKHLLWVDDGYGLTDAKGNLHHAIAYCNDAYWNRIIAGVQDLAWAYAMTSEARYAHKAAVLLDRIADVYPEMDYYPLGKLGFQHSHGGTLQGRIRGKIWECNTGEALARAYDLIFDGIQADPELVAFCAAQSARCKLADKGSAAAICRHIEDQLLLEILRSVKDGRIDGNTGMSHTCLALAAIALDRPGLTDEWLDWLFDPAFPVTNPAYRRAKDPVPWAMVEGLDRDGMGGECGGYGLIWSRCMLRLAEILADYPAYQRHDLLKEYPKLRQCVLVEARLNVLDAVMPNFGDTGACGSWGRVGAAEHFLRGYRLFGDPRMAAWAWRRAEGKASALRLRPTTAFAEDPEALVRAVEAAAGQADPRLSSDFLSRYGQAVLQTERPESGRAVALHFGAGKGHSHHDNLSLGLFAQNVDLLPDHGYPAFTGSYPQRIAWTANTSSHCTLMVDDCRSAYSPGGKLELFAVQAPLRVMQVASPGAYGQTLEAYRRCVALIDVSDTDSYVLDVFRARGGATHRLILCGGATTAAPVGLDLVPQEKGTFAGPEVAFEALPGKGETLTTTSGFSYLTEVARSRAGVTAPYTVDWRIEDLRGRIKDGAEPHLRVHALTPCDEVALASGQPPQNKKGNPASLRYLIQSRFGQGLRSQYVSVLEPYEKTPFIRAVRPLPVITTAAPDTVAAVAVELTDGRTDILIACEQPSRVSVEGDIEMEGLFGLVRRQGTEVKSLRLSGGTLLRAGAIEVRSPQAAWTGVVKAVDLADPTHNRLELEPPLPTDPALVGRPLHILNSLDCDTSFPIQASDGAHVSTGELGFIAGFKDPKDFAAGVTLQVNPGDRYVVHALAALDR